jgi:PAS domain S-box-containing protein
MGNIEKAIVNNKFIDLFPNNLAIIDDQYKVLYANKGFKDSFGNIVGKKINTLKDGSESPFGKDKLNSLIEGDEDRVSYKTSFALSSIRNHYTINASVLLSVDSPKNIIILANNISGTNHWQKEFNLLFEKVPAFISILDRDHHIIRANDKFREYFGDVKGKHGYDGYHKKRQDIINCPAEYTFEDKGEHTSTVVGYTQNGEKIKLVVNSVPMAYDSNGVSLVMEIGLDISEITLLQEQLQHAHEFYSSIIDNAVDAIIAITNKGKTQIINNEARRILAWDSTRKPGVVKIKEFMPDEFFNEPDETGMIIKHAELEVTNENKEKVPVKFSAFELRNKKKPMGKVAFFHDLSRLKSLEREKIEAEKEAINFTFSTIGGKMQKVIDIQRNAFYQFKQSLETENISKINTAWEKLEAKFEIRNMISEKFLHYSKGVKPNLQPVDINEILEEVQAYCKKMIDKLDILCDFQVSKIDKFTTDPELFKAIVEIPLLNSIRACLDSEENVICKIKLFAEIRENHLIVDIYDNSTMIEKSDEKFGILTTKMLLDKLNGMVDVSDNRKDGSRVSIILPLKS